MKSTIIFCTFFSLAIALTQDEYVIPKISKTGPKENPKLSTLKHTLAELTSGISSTKNFIADMDQVLKVVTKPEMINFSKIVLKKCDYVGIESNISFLTNVTVDLVFNVTGAFQAILDQGNECASEGFPKSLSCFLQLVNTCKVDVEEIKAALSVYIPVARGLVLKIFSNIVSCYMS